MPYAGELRAKLGHATGADAVLRGVGAALEAYRCYIHGERFDDLLTKYRENVNVSSRPYNHPENGKPGMSDEDIDAIVAFLGTLTDAAFVPGSSGPS